MRDFLYKLKFMMPVFVVISLVLICQVITCYWLSLIHWTVGLFGACVWLGIDIYSWSERNNY